MENIKIKTETVDRGLCGAVGTPIAEDTLSAQYSSTTRSTLGKRTFPRIAGSNMPPSTPDYILSDEPPFHLKRYSTPINSTVAQNKGEIVDGTQALQPAPAVQQLYECFVLMMKPHSDIVLSFNSYPLQLDMASTHGNVDNKPLKIHYYPAASHRITPSDSLRYFNIILADKPLHTMFFRAIPYEPTDTMQSWFYQVVLHKDDQILPVNIKQTGFLTVFGAQQTAVIAAGNVPLAVSYYDIERRVERVQFQN